MSVVDGGGRGVGVGGGETEVAIGGDFVGGLRGDDALFE